jgi:hypothetical protein
MKTTLRANLAGPGNDILPSANAHADYLARASSSSSLESKESGFNHYNNSEFSSSIRSRASSYKGLLFAVDMFSRSCKSTHNAVIADQSPGAVFGRDFSAGSRPSKRHRSINELAHYSICSNSNSRTYADLSNKKQYSGYLCDRSSDDDSRVIPRMTLVTGSTTIQQQR